MVHSGKHIDTQLTSLTIEGASNVLESVAKQSKVISRRGAKNIVVISTEVISKILHVSLLKCLCKKVFLGMWFLITFLKLSINTETWHPKYIRMDKMCLPSLPTYIFSSNNGYDSTIVLIWLFIQYRPVFIHWSC